MACGIGRARELEAQVTSVLPTEVKDRTGIGPVDLGEIAIADQRYQVVYGRTNFPLRSVGLPDQPITFAQTSDRVVSVISIGKDGSRTASRPIAYDQDVVDLDRFSPGVRDKITAHLHSIRAGKVNPSWEIVRPQVRRVRPGAITY